MQLILYSSEYFINDKEVLLATRRLCSYVLLLTISNKRFQINMWTWAKKKILKRYRLIVSKCVRQRLQKFLCILPLGSPYWNFSKKKEHYHTKIFFFFFRTSLLRSATKCLKLLNNSSVLLPTSFNHILSHSAMINTQLHQRPYHIACIATKKRNSRLYHEITENPHLFTKMCYSPHMMRNKKKITVAVADLGPIEATQSVCVHVIIDLYRL